MLRLTNLTAWASVTNLSGLEYATNLESLWLDRARPSTFSPLSGLARLQSLSLEYLGTQDLSGIASLSTLTNLDLYSSLLTNLGCLGALTNLVCLDVSWNRVSDPTALAGLPRLQYLDLSGNPLGDGSVLANLTNLCGSLYVESVVSMTNIQCLGGLTNLTSLSIYENAVTDVGPLSNLTSLAALDLGYVPVRDFSALSSLTNLQILYVQGTSLSNLSRLPALPKLTTLDANYNHLSELNTLAAFTNLHWLNASFNHLTNINALTNLGKLGDVYLQVNLLNTNGGSPDMTVVQSLLSKGAHVEYAPQHQPPYVSLPEQWLVPANETSSLSLSISDDLVPGDQLALSVRSSNTGLVTAVLSPTALSPFLAGEGERMAYIVSGPNPPQIPGWYGYLNIIPVPNQSGTALITVTATDDAGLSTEATMTVTVSEPAFFDGPMAGNSDTNATWRTLGVMPWTGQTSVVHEAGSAAQSGSTGSWLEASVTGPGMLSFWWRYSASNWWASPKFTASCAQSGLTGHAWMSRVGAYPGGAPAPDWEKATLSIPAGHWVMRWQAGEAYDSNSPVLWVAELSFTPGPSLCWLEIASSGIYAANFHFNLHGPPGETYDLEVSPDLQQWSRLKRLTLTDFRTWWADTNAAVTPARFYRLRKSSLAPMWLDKPVFDPARIVRVTLHSEPEQPLLLECSTDLLRWETLTQTNNPTGLLRFDDNSATNSNIRFYRAKALPWGVISQGSPRQPNERRRHPSFPRGPIPIPGRPTL